MKNRKIKYFRNTILLGLVLITGVSCDRELSDDARNATYPKTAEIFIEDVVGMGSNFYFPYGGSKPSAWTIDREVGYNSNASMRFDVPNADDPQGSYAGAIFRTEGAGRDLSGYDALTFYIKASRGVTIDQFGFGEDFFPNKYITTIKNVSVGTNWTKVIIPIPNASVLVKERGMFRYAAGTLNTGNFGYTFWIDDLKFEKLGTISQPVPSIANGVNRVINALIGVPIPLADLKVTCNLASGINQVVYPAPDYFVFRSSNPNVATVNAVGEIAVLAPGTTVITANIGGVLNTATNEIVGGINSIDSITINSSGIAFVLAPTPTVDPSRVLSVYSDTYTNVPVTYTNGFWTPGSTTGSADFSVNGNNILNYTTFNYVGIATSNPTLNCSNMTRFHLDIYVPFNVPSNFDFLISIEDWGPNQVDNGFPQDDTRQQIFVRRNQVQANTWISVDAPLTLVNKNNIGLIIMENINGSSLSNFYVDNVYFYN